MPRPVAARSAETPRRSARVSPPTRRHPSRTRSPCVACSDQFFLRRTVRLSTDWRETRTLVTVGSLVHVACVSQAWCERQFSAVAAPPHSGCRCCTSDISLPPLLVRCCATLSTARSRDQPVLVLLLRQPCSSVKLSFSCPSYAGLLRPLLFHARVSTEGQALAQRLCLFHVVRRRTPDARHDCNNYLNILFVLSACSSHSDTSEPGVFRMLPSANNYRTDKWQK